MHASNTLSSPGVSSHPLRMGNKPELPEPPPHVPEKFAKVWASLPGCCRNFYMSPGKGCCAGMPEPNPGIMDAAKTTAAKTGCKTGNCGSETAANSHKAKLKPKIAPALKKRLGAIQDWFKYLCSGFLKDMKRILSGSKTD